ncbi:mitochondrial import inner membrane translocase subunit tim54 [Mitosporidium daphniae]|uniref:Mitochondrial import inner membrane translocase subunit TIM54 n=1 Tax=Mitosporidium daphniae TaxID=1485682 RepID=A0A098VW07_9MICR|nr:uncharacterized protein DI09_10p340 [Mitosporidium daphniae]KGG53137.1 hypothetical protein DI09_10p340 [Mitosporidium daphniae]|eukprot:XP_013239564.1 uncharacterized protein DI09_10p340 [Mitosporidium daphniae]
MLFSFLKANRGPVIAASVVGIPSALFAWDRFESNRLLNNYKALAKSYGDSPMPHNQLPTKMTFLVESCDKESLSKQFELFEEFIEPILTAAGLEFEWIEASAKKHLQQLEEDDQKSQSSSFADINSWRVHKWLNKEINELENTKLRNDAYENLSTLNKIAIYLGLTSPPTTQQLFGKGQQILKNSGPAHTDAESEPAAGGDFEQHILTAKEKILNSLLPKSPGLQAFQQGLIIFGEANEFRAVFRTVRGVYAEKPEGWMLAFGQYPFRFGFISSPRKRSLVQRMFFKHRLARSLLSSAFDVASDDFLLLNPVIEQSLVVPKGNVPSSTDVSECSTNCVLSPTGTILLLKTATATATEAT